jgi:hypothetical protein
MNGSGDELAAWECVEVVGSANVWSIQEAMRPAGGSWSAASTVASYNGIRAESEAVAIDGSGHGLLVWQHYLGNNPQHGFYEFEIDAAVIASDGSISNQMTLSQDGSGLAPDVAMNSAGDAVVGWWSYSSTGQGEGPFATLGTLSGGFQTAQKLDSYGPPSGAIAWPIAVAVDSGGDAAATWGEYGEAARPVAAAVSVAGGPFSSAAAVPSGGTVAMRPAITIDANGNVTVVLGEQVAPEPCSGSTGSTIGTCEYLFDAAREPLTGGFGSLQNMSDARPIIGEPALASNSTGDTVAAWDSQVAVGDWRVEKAVFQTGMAFQPPVQVAQSEEQSPRVSAAIDGSGIPSVSWTQRTAPGAESFASFVSTGDPVVSQLPMGAVSPVLVSDAAGDLGAVWAGSTRSGTAIYASNASALPTVTAINPIDGPAAGGTAVTITGTNFTGVSAVKFGATQASFKVDSPTSITATSPAGSGTVGVTVTTSGGTSSTGPGDQFTYQPSSSTQNETPSNNPGSTTSSTDNTSTTSKTASAGAETNPSKIVPSVKVKTLTGAQKLARALAACRHSHGSKRLRVRCEAKARKRYRRRRTPAKHPGNAKHKG